MRDFQITISGRVTDDVPVGVGYGEEEIAFLNRRVVSLVKGFFGPGVEVFFEMGQAPREIPTVVDAFNRRDQQR